MHRSGGAYQTLVAQGGDGKVETDAPCPACICPACGGSGVEHTSAPRNAEHFPEEGQRESGKRGVIGNLGDNSMIETGEPCPTCGGVGATGRTSGKTWDAEVLGRWPRRPCVVLDPMAGSGQTGRAALSLGRSVILNDLNPSYCDLAQERLEAWPEDVPGAKKKAKDSAEPAPLPMFEN